MRNVALFGAMGAGKTTIADALSRAGYQRISMAGPLKAVAELAYGKIDKGKLYQVTQEDGSLSSLSGREILQGIGQTIKGVDRNFWLRCFQRQASSFGDTPLVVDDGRFLFEFDALKADGWLTIGVNTSEPLREQRYESIYGRKPTESEMNHQSEIEVPQILLQCDVPVQGTDDPYVNAKKILDKAKNGRTRTET